MASGSPLGPGVVEWEQNEHTEAQLHLEQALALFRQVDDQMGIADALHWLGHLALAQSDYARARSSFQDSYTRLKDFGDRVSLNPVAQRFRTCILSSGRLCPRAYI